MSVLNLMNQLHSELEPSKLKLECSIPIIGALCEELRSGWSSVAFPAAAWLLDFCVVKNMEKSMSKAELSKEMCTSPAMHPNNYRNNEAPIKDDVNARKGETSSTAVVVGVPIANS
ncbi:hypothetical protein J1N35_005399 [Gossypium stocksii]|uniref:Uncharacterized protein n=1 Tax=Gossypium stocksii TaxID=47602 RepID=A0A9D4AIK2_9ROSI|nr:hypothetical protein J1N35_005399 [Gossypium stocksii]